jgi:tetratricopeptide (TPR) repeat protein
MKMLGDIRQCILLLGLALCMNGWAHESITTEARKNYLIKLQESNQVLLAKPPVPVKAKTLYQIGVTLEEIRDLFNQDIISHGAVKGLESNLLLTELARAGFKLEMSPKIGLYLSQLHYYREAIKLDGKAVFADHARYLWLKNHFYDSFTDNPLTPLSQSKDELSELIDIGERLQKVKDKNIHQEEVKFILAIHYLQAVQQQLIGKDDGLKKFKKLLAELSRDYPQSLKPMTLEALSAGL